MVSAKDYVWVYGVKPSRQALATLALFWHCPAFLVRRSRTTLSASSASLEQLVLYLRLPIPRKNLSTDLYWVSFVTEMTHLQAVFEGAPDAVSLTPIICGFRLDEAFLSSSRPGRDTMSPRQCGFRNLSRLSTLVCNSVTLFVGSSRYTQRRQSYPLCLSRPTKEDEQWLVDKAGSFEKYYRFPEISNVALSALCNNNHNARRSTDVLDDCKTQFSDLSVLCPIRPHGHIHLSWMGW
ncbi:hypothetical protein RB195_017484 [Necator americanus]|uniref:Uncharacterized protein n=1 Tax=Necator americanus TaxID=51031 RepID=A0ABR1C7Y1_NECAM